MSMFIKAVGVSSMVCSGMQHRIQKALLCILWPKAKCLSPPMWLAG